MLGIGPAIVVSVWFALFSAFLAWNKQAFVARVFFYAIVGIWIYELLIHLL